MPSFNGRRPNFPLTVSLLLTGLGDNLYRPFSPHFTIENLKNRRRRLKGFTTLLSSLESQKRSRFWYRSVIFSVLNGWGIYRPQPNSKFELKTIKSIKPQNFWDQAVAPLDWRGGTAWQSSKTELGGCITWQSSKSELGGCITWQSSKLSSS